MTRDGERRKQRPRHRETGLDRNDQTSSIEDVREHPADYREEHVGEHVGGLHQGDENRGVRGVHE